MLYRSSTDNKSEAVPTTKSEATTQSKYAILRVVVVCDRVSHTMSSGRVNSNSRELLLVKQFRQSFERSKQMDCELFE